MSVKLAVKKTIEYASSFGSHININEIKKRLISKKIYPEKEIEKEISKLNWKNKKNKWKKIKLIKARRLASLIENKFGEILFLGVTGSVASAHPKKNDDIDLLVITKTNKLWRNRLLLRWWTYINKIPHRKFDQNEVKDQFCFNLWLDENNLKIPKNRYNMNNATDLLLLQPLINRQNTYEKFILNNNWAKKFVATGYCNLVKRLSSETCSSIKNKNGFSWNKVSNWLYFWPQYWYMKPKMSKEKVSLYQAFFHR